MHAEIINVSWAMASVWGGPDVFISEFGTPKPPPDQSGIRYSYDIKIRTYRTMMKRGVYLVLSHQQRF